MKNNKPLLALLSAGLSGFIVTSAHAVSIQQFAVDAGAVNFTEVDPQLNANIAAAAPQATLAAPTTVTFADTRSNTTLTGDPFDDSFFEATNYIGAVDPAAATPFWNTGWTLHQGPGSLADLSADADGLIHPLEDDITAGDIAPSGGACPIGTGGQVSESIFGVQFPVCVINAAITSDVTLTNGHVYALNGTINVGDGGAQAATAATASNVTLTIEAGVQIYGIPGTTAGIIINRGSNIIVNGTADQPVVMSSSDGTGLTGIGGDDDFVGGGDWGGLIIDGFAVVNEGAEVLSEAAPDGVNRFFGGTDPADSSGSINYLVIAESGEEFRQDEEIQGLTLEGVGSRTTIDFVQIHNSDDDGIELFGGTVNLKHAIVIGVDDDSFDFDLGWQGGLQFGIAVQIDGQGDRTIESDNNGDNFDLTPITMPTFSNVTLIGRGGRNDADTIGALHREGLGGFFHKMIITDAATAAPDQYEDGCLDIDDTTARISAGQFAYQDAIFNCAVPGSLATADEDVPPPAPTAAADLAASVLPSSRSVQVGNTATAFASVTNATGDTGTGCDISPATTVTADFQYQTTDANNELTGTPDTPVDIPANATQSFLFAFTPTAAFDSTDVQLSFNCTNKNPATAVSGLNTLVLSATTGPEPDVIGLTTTVDLQIPGASGSTAFAVATANAGAAGDITATASAPGVPVSLSICETDPATGECLSAAGPDVTTTIGAGATPTFAVFVTATGDIANDPANNRVFVNFTDGAGSVKGSTSTAVRTQ